MLPKRPNIHINGICLFAASATHTPDNSTLCDIAASQSYTEHRSDGSPMAAVNARGVDPRDQHRNDVYYLRVSLIGEREAMFL